MATRDSLARAGLWLFRWAKNPAEDGMEMQPLYNRFAALKAYYDTNRTYSRLRYGLQAQGATEFLNIDNLRSPAFEAVEFHVGHHFPGTLPDALPLSQKKTLKPADYEALKEVWKASNFSSKKQTLVRTTAWSGNGFLRVAQRKSDGHPIKKVMEPQYVREFQVDDRGYVEYLRYAYPVKRGRGTKAQINWVTEVFDKERGDLRIFEDKMPIDDPDRQKGADVKPFEGMGVDFLPVVWCPFLETRPGMGVGVFEPFLDRIDNVNRAATRLHDMLFRYNRPVWALESSAINADNLDIPPPDTTGSWSTNYTNLTEDERDARGYGATVRNDDGTMTLGSDPLARLPGGWSLASMIPQVDYQSALNIVNDDMEGLRRDMPELRYNDAINSAARDSARVLELQLAGATERANEARGNAEAAIIRASQMALTMGKNSKENRAGMSLSERKEYDRWKEKFQGVGDFKTGELDFEFENRPIIIPTPTDKANEELSQAQALSEKIAAFQAMGLSVDILQEEAAKLAGVDKSKLVVDPLAAQAVLPEDQAGPQATQASGNVVKQVLDQARGGTSNGQSGGPGGASQPRR